MPTYAILGGTGQTGSAIIRHLLSTDTKLHIYVRSTSKLRQTIPELDEAHASQIDIFSGNIKDVYTMVRCLRGVDVVFMAAATNENHRSVRIAQDAAESIVSALERLRSEATDTSKYKPPTVVFLSSASLAPHLSHIPRPVHWLLFQALYYVYTDVALGIKHIRNQGWIPLIEVCPNGLTQGKAVGFHLITEPAKEGFNTYTDLGAAMVQAAHEGDKWVGKQVGVGSLRKVEDAQPGVLAKYLFWGLVASWAPRLYDFGRDWGMW